MKAIIHISSENVSHLETEIKATNHIKSFPFPYQTVHPSMASWLGQNKKGIPKLRKAFRLAKTTDEKLKIFAKVEARLQENQLSWDCWRMVLHLSKEGEDPLKILSFGKRALNIFLHHENNPALGIQRSSFGIGNVLHMLGSACLELKRYNESLGYLNWSDRNLSTLLSDHFCDDLVLLNLHETQCVLFKLKKAMGRLDEAVFHAKRVLEIREKIVEKGCVSIGEANKDVFEAYFQVGNFKEALAFALKALEIYKKHFSDDSEEIALLRTGLVSTYSVLEEHDKAFEHHQLSLSGLKSIGNNSLSLNAELMEGHMLFKLRRYEEAIQALKLVISHAKTVVDPRDRNETADNQLVIADASMVMATAFCRQEKFPEARKYIKIALRNFQKLPLDPEAMATRFMDMANLYEEMKEYEVGILLVQKALDIPELPKDHLAYCSYSLFSLVSLSGTEEKRLSSLEEVVERLKDNFGPENCHVGHVCVNLGLVYKKLGRPEIAEELLGHAKDILDVSGGRPYHLDSLIASQTLSVAYEGMKSYDLAIEIQERVVEGFKGLGLSEQDRANEAVQTLSRMKGGR